MADPPAIRGIIDGLTIRRLVSWTGEGRSRVFSFDVLGDISVSRLVKMKAMVALSPVDGAEPLILRSLSRLSSVSCPQCGLEMLPIEFWEHYNTFHARRVNWLNEEDWTAMRLKLPYVVPPEQR